MTGIVGKCSMIVDTAFALVCFVQFPVMNGVRRMCVGHSAVRQTDIKTYKFIRFIKNHKKEKET